MQKSTFHSYSRLFYSRWQLQLTFYIYSQLFSYRRWWFICHIMWNIPQYWGRGELIYSINVITNGNSITIPSQYNIITIFRGWMKTESGSLKSSPVCRGWMNSDFLIYWIHSPRRGVLGGGFLKTFQRYSQSGLRKHCRLVIQFEELLLNKRRKLSFPHNCQIRCVNSDTHLFTCLSVFGQIKTWGG